MGYKTIFRKRKNGRVYPKRMQGIELGEFLASDEKIDVEIWHKSKKKQI